MKTPVIMLAATFLALPLHSQIFLDNFEVGEFTQAGSGNVYTEGSHQDIFRGERRFSLYNGITSSASVADGSFNITKNDSSGFRLTYGSANELIYFPLNRYWMSIDVSSMTGPITIRVVAYTGEPELIWPDPYDPEYYGHPPEVTGHVFWYSSEMTATISEPGTAVFRTLDLVGDAHPGDISVIDVEFATGAAEFGTFQISAMTLTPIPEPHHYGMMFGIGLLGLAAYRRRSHAP